MTKRKRSRGEGTVAQAADGRWVGRASLGYKDGKRVRKAVYAQTKAEAVKKLRAVLTLRDTGQVVPVGAPTLAKFLGTWLEDCKHQSVRSSTYEGYERIVKLHVNPALGKVLIDKLRPDQIQAFLTQKGRNLAPATVKSFRVLLVGALEKAVVWGLVVRNVARLTDAPHIPKPKVRTLTLAESKIFLKALEGERFEALLVLSLTTGLRRSEALGVSWDNLDLQRGQLQIRSGLQRIGTELKLVPTKSGKARVVMLGRRAIDALTRHRTRQLEQKLAAGSTWPNDVIPGQTGLAFTTSAGTPVWPKTLDGHFKRVLVRAGLPNIRLHDLRHSCATNLLEQGVNAKIVSEMLGHSSISVTVDLYQHVSQTMQESAVRMMDAALGD